MNSQAFAGVLAGIAALAVEILIPAELEMVRRGAVPDHALAAMREHGLFGMTTPTKFGGLGLTPLQQTLVTMEITRASLVYRSRFSTNIGLCAQGILRFGTVEQRATYLPGMAIGETVMSFALTEESAGSDAKNVSTTATLLDTGEYRIDGEKRYVTNAAWADAFLVIAREIVDKEDVGLSAFIVPRHSGLSCELPSAMNGHEEAPVGSLRFENVKVAANSRLGKRGAGLAVAMQGINTARSHVAAAAVGQSNRLIAEMLDHARTRKQFGMPLGEMPTVQSDIAQCWADSQAAKAMVLECARAIEISEEPPRYQIAAAKYFCTEVVGRIADRAVQLLGGAGIVGPSSVPRIWRDVRTLRIYEGASEIHLRNVGRWLVGSETVTPP